MSATRPLRVADAVPSTATTRRRRLAMGIALMCLAAGTVGVASADSDLDNDGFDDLVVGVPDENVGQSPEAGVVNVLEGSSLGITARGDRLYDHRDLGGSVEPIDRFGNTVAYGNFNGDAYMDVAIGSPTEDYRGKKDAGVVHILYGTSNGVRPVSAQLVSQVGKMKGKNEAGDFLGAVLATGDFDGDGYDDLAMGAPGEDISGRIAAGGVVVAYGGRNGIKTSGSQMISQKGKVPGGAESRDSFGASLTAGDFNGDGRDDLAIGVPGEDIGGTVDAGVVIVLYGRGTGLDKDGKAFSQGGAVPGDVTAHNAFGLGLTAGDFNGDGVDDLAVGAPGERRLVLFSGAKGSRLSAAATSGVAVTELPSAIAQGDRFGKVLAAGDFDADGDDELAVGSQHSAVDGHAEAGQVVILGTGVAGVAPGSALALDQSSMGGAPEAGDQLGSALRVGDFNGDKVDDLAMAAAHEDIGRKRDSGIVFVAHGAAGAGLQAGDVTKFHQGTRGVNGKAEAGDRFGAGL